MLKNVYEGLNVRSKVYLSKVYFCEMYSTCVSSKLCEFICHEQTGGGGIGDSRMGSIAIAMNLLFPFAFLSFLSFLETFHNLC